jgi:hypothetical protein
MASWEEIERRIRRRKAQIRLFLRYAHRAGIRPFYGQARKDPRRLLLVSPDLSKRGSWRVTWFVDEKPYGHVVHRSFDAAVRDAVDELGLDLETVRFQADRDPRRARRRR